MESGWDLLEILGWILSALVDESKHFTLGFVGAFVLFYLTQTTLSALLLIRERSTQELVSTGVVYFTYFISISCGVFGFLYSHHLLDGFVTLYTLPLDETIKFEWWKFWQFW